jgi:hypothetical protein
VNSFKKVNMQPDHRVLLSEWLDRIREQIFTGERFFKERENSIFDAMPAIWHNMPIEIRHKLVKTIDGFFVSATPGTTPWSKENLKTLIQFAPLHDVHKLRACYLVAKLDPLVYVGHDNSSTNVATVSSPTDKGDPFYAFRFAVVKPTAMVDALQHNRHDKNIQSRFLNHVTNLVAMRHHKSGPGHSDKESKKDFVPSSYLALEMSDRLRTFLNPKPEDIVLGAYAQDAVGEGAIKRVAKRRL